MILIDIPDHCIRKTVGIAIIDIGCFHPETKLEEFVEFLFSFHLFDNMSIQVEILGSVNLHINKAANVCIIYARIQ